MISHKGFKKIHEDANHAVLMHPEGHKIHIAKQSLSEKVRKQLTAIPMAEGGWMEKIGSALAPEPDIKPGSSGGKPLPKTDPDKAKSFVKGFNSAYADGGSVMPEQDTAQMQFPPETRKAMAEQELGISGPNVNLGQQQMPNEAAPASAATPERIAQISASPEGQQMANEATPQMPGVEDINQITHKQQAAIADEAKAQKNLSHEQIRADADNIIATQGLQKEHAMKLAELQKERAALQKDVQDGHIDPQHYLNSRTTGQKISQAIGLFLGGIGSGLAGGENPAVKFIDSEIDRDIAAQKANLGKKENLLSAFQHQFGNLEDATKMTRVFMNDQLASRLHREAARANDPIVAARAQQMIQQKELENMQLTSAVAQNQAQRKMNERALQSGNIEAAIPSLVPDKGQQKQVLEAYGAAKNLAENKKNVMAAFDKANEENTIVGRISHGFSQPASVTSFGPLLFSALHDSLGRVNIQEVHMMQELLPQPGDAPGKVAEKRKAMEQFLEQKQAAHETILKAHGIPLPAAKPGAKGNTKTLKGY